MYCNNKSGDKKPNQSTNYSRKIVAVQSNMGQDSLTPPQVWVGVCFAWICQLPRSCSLTFCRDENCALLCSHESFEATVVCSFEVERMCWWLVCMHSLLSLTITKFVLRDCLLSHCKALLMLVRRVWCCIEHILNMHEYFNVCYDSSFYHCKVPWRSTRVWSVAFFVASLT